MIGMATPTSDRIQDPSVVRPVVGSMPPLTLTTAIAGSAARIANMTRDVTQRRDRNLIGLPFGWHDARRRSVHQRHPEPAAWRGSRPPTRAVADVVPAAQRRVARRVGRGGGGGRWGGEAVSPARDGEAPARR